MVNEGLFPTHHLLSALPTYTRPACTAGCVCMRPPMGVVHSRAPVVACTPYTWLL